jgi:hypothetical protein
MFEITKIDMYESKGTKYKYRAFLEYRLSYDNITCIISASANSEDELTEKITKKAYMDAIDFLTEILENRDKTIDDKNRVIHRLRKQRKKAS